MNSKTVVNISDSARLELARLMRQWSGWRDATLTFDVPPNGTALTDTAKHAFTVNADAFVLNPNRVIHHVTPFRLRQEAVLTGAMLHEAAHARFSRWLTPGVEPVHIDGSAVSAATMSLARTLEEARVEAKIAAECDRIGAAGLDWTMRAMAAHVIPATQLSTDPDQQVMDVIHSYVLRAGRIEALVGQDVMQQSEVPVWVNRFRQLLHEVLTNHFASSIDPGSIDDPAEKATYVLQSIDNVIKDSGSLASINTDASPWVMDKARDILSLLFPETPPEEQPQGSAGGCAMGGEGQSGDSGSSNEGDSGDEEQEGGSGDGDESDESGQSGMSEAGKALAEALQAAEGSATKAEEEAASDEASKALASGGTQGGAGTAANMPGEWRDPKVSERMLAKGAERFLRGLLNPTETTVVSLSDSPAATVDGAAMAAWRAGGSRRDPRFFRRTRRASESAPPVKIAILVDVSGSMDALQEPSAVLSWAMANAAMDMRNFAGRGQRIESCLIHWGSHARVIQPTNTPLPGIHEVACNEGTWAMRKALDLVEEQIPGFFDASEKPENRLLVQFTDWELNRESIGETATSIGRALSAGVNMLTIVPPDFSPRRSRLDAVLSMCPVVRGRVSQLTYNPKFPEQVWDHAAKMLSI